MSDLRYAVRSLFRNPAFAGVAILTLALAIGANTAMFSIFNSVLLRPLPYPQPERLYAVQVRVPKFAQLQEKLPVSAHHFLQWRAHTTSFDSLSLVGTAGMSLTSAGDPQNLTIGRISASLFRQLGVVPELGRAFTDAEDQKGRDQVLVLSHALWSSRFQSDRTVIGRKVLLDGSPYEVIGVLSPETVMPKLRELVSIPLDTADAQAWKPFGLDDNELTQMGNFDFGCIARLKPGIGAAQALSDLDNAQKAIAASLPDKVDLYGSLTPLREQITAPASASLTLLLAAGGAVILIVCGNVASLLLIRVNSRRREIAVRTAMGAGTARLTRQFATESLLLAAMAGVFGVVFANWMVKMVVLNAPADLARVNEIHMDGRVLGFAMILSILTGLACGLLPAWRLVRVGANEALKANSRGVTEGRHGGRLRNLLGGLEVGLSVVALIVSSLLLNSFVRLMNVDKGFQTDRTTTVTLNLPARYRSAARKDEFLRTLIDRVQRAPGVVAGGVASMLPVSGEGMNNPAVPEGAQIPLMERPLVDFRSVSPGYLRALTIPLLAGRMFEERDRSRQVALLSMSAARRLWPEGGAMMGRKFHLGEDSSPALEVIGLVGDVHGVSLQAPPNPTVYLPYWARQWRPLISVVARTSGDPRAIAGEIRSQIRKIDPELPVPQFLSMEDIVDSSVSQRRFQLRLMLLFGIASTLLAAMGVYGVVAFAVSQRTSEMGLRMVLGASQSEVRTMVWRQGMKPVAVGIGAGLIASFAASRLLTGFLFGVHAADPATLGSAAATLLLVTGAACYIPARRATRVDPAIAMRYE